MTRLIVPGVELPLVHTETQASNNSVFDFTFDFSVFRKVRLEFDLLIQDVAAGVNLGGYIDPRGSGSGSLINAGNCIQIINTGVVQEQDQPHLPLYWFLKSTSAEADNVFDGFVYAENRDDAYGGAIFWGQILQYAPARTPNLSNALLSGYSEDLSSWDELEVYSGNVNTAILIGSTIKVYAK